MTDRLNEWLARLHLLVYRGGTDERTEVEAQVDQGNECGHVETLGHTVEDEPMLMMWDTVRDNLRWNYGYVLAHSKKRLVIETVPHNRCEH